MFPLQEVNFHLASNEVIFAQLLDLGDGTFTATVTMPHKYSEIPEVKYFSWLACPSKSSPAMAFKEIISAIDRHCAKTPGNKLVKVNNPCNCEFLSQEQQMSIAGSGVTISVNEPI